MALAEVSNAMLKNRGLKIVTVGIFVSPLALNAEVNFFTDKLPPIVNNIAEGVEVGRGEEATRSEVQNYSLGVANDAIDGVEQRILSNSNFTHFDVTIGSDTLGVNGTDAKTKTEAMTVYRLHEHKNMFVFNQASIVGFDGRTTLNLGLGVRHINDAETVIMGGNVFYDYELDSKHKRSGFGFELLTSMLEFRTNKYSAISGTINYKGIDETTLDGHDIKLSTNMPYFYSSNFYFKKSEFKDTAGYSTKADEWGVQAEVVPNLVLGVASQKKTGSSAQTVASVSYSIPLGGSAQPAKQMQDGVWSTKPKPIREKLYQPVQRENRIMKKIKKGSLTFGVF